MAVIAKPFALDALAARVRTMLEAAPLPGEAVPAGGAAPGALRPDGSGASLGG